MMSSIMACATCTPLGLNSYVSDCVGARRMNFMIAKVAKSRAFDGVASVKIKESEWVGGGGAVVE